MVGMIERLRIKNFKSLRDVDLRLGRLNLLIGANASGKSNFLDALRVLQGIGYGFSFREILDGKPKGAANDVWEPIRGGSSQAMCRAARSDECMSLEMQGRLTEEDHASWIYAISLEPNEWRLESESLRTGKPIFTAKRETLVRGKGAVIVDAPSWRDISPLDRARFGQNLSPIEKARFRRDLEDIKGGKIPSGRYHARDLGFADTKPILAQIAAGHFRWPESSSTAASYFSQSLRDLQFLNPQPPILRAYSPRKNAERLGATGEDFAALIETLGQSPKDRSSFLAWLKELRPEQIDDFGTLAGAVNEPMFYLKENGVKYPAPVLSDGTLRFAALAAALYQPEPPSVLCVEEIEQSIHPSRLRLVVELLRAHSRPKGSQVFATTHSPVVADWLMKEEHDHLFVFTRVGDTGETRVRTLADYLKSNPKPPRAALSDLLVEDWFATAP
ncbi:MAG: AAA family ATPase [Planctomycetes bacterium]|nr:AAA family ATPase [Planctomycetota bacterium]